MNPALLLTATLLILALASLGAPPPPGVHP